MATRISSTGSIAIHYEDFEPNFQWKEEEGANILLVHLPDFQKEQVKITYVHSSRVIKVTGEQPISNKKWRRFNKSFPVPENCNVQKIQAKFQSPSLTITLPKITPTKLPSESKEMLKNPRTETLKPQLSDKAHSTVTDDKKKEEKEAIDEETKKKEEEGERDKALSEKDQENINKKKRKESLEAPTPSDQEISKKRKESSEASTPSDNEISKKRKEEKSSEMENYSKFGEKAKEVKKRVMGLATEMSEDKQSLVNIGVAILVIAALGAYISYSYGSSGNSKN